MKSREDQMVAIHGYEECYPPIRHMISSSCIGLLMVAAVWKTQLYISNIFGAEKKFLDMHNSTNFVSLLHGRRI